MSCRLIFTEPSDCAPSINVITPRDLACWQMSFAGSAIPLKFEMCEKAISFVLAVIALMIGSDQSFSEVGFAGTLTFLIVKPIRFAFILNQVQ